MWKRNFTPKRQNQVHNDERFVLPVWQLWRREVRRWHAAQAPGDASESKLSFFLCQITVIN